MHELVCPDNRVDRAGSPAVVATDTGELVNNSDGRDDALCEWNDFSAEQSSEPSNRVVTSGRAEIDCRRAVDHSSCEGSATRISALGTLCLRQQFIDLLHKVAFVRRQAPLCVTQGAARDERNYGDCDDSYPHTNPSGPGHAGKAHESKRHDAGGH